MNSSELDRLVEAIHATSLKVVIEFAGAGAQALAWLHGVSGSSRTILEATDRYAATSLVEAIGFEPAQFVAPAVARAMATSAYRRACHLAGRHASVAGVGCTATIATDRTKRGDHRCFVAVCTAEGVAGYALTLTKGARSRPEEEQLVSLVILQAIASSCGLPVQLPLPLQGQEKLETRIETASLLDRLQTGEFDQLLAWPDGGLTPADGLPNIALLSGSFNPLHPGHRELARVAGDILGQSVYFELPLVNADKSPIDATETSRRVAQFSGVAPVILTRAPLFSQKARLFPHSVFITGADTVARLVQTRFYNGSRAEMLASLNQIRTAGCRFLVAGRLHGERFLTLADLTLPDGYRELFEAIPPDEFRLDISSTKLREQGATSQP